jgi:hypothetical protein
VTHFTANHLGMCNAKKGGKGAGDVEHVLAWAHSPHLHGWNDDVIGYIASALVLATFSMRSMQSLRMIAIASNVAFITYAVVADLRPILILHSILLPVNAVRLAQIQLAKGWPWRIPPVHGPAGATG